MITSRRDLLAGAAAAAGLGALPAWGQDAAPKPVLPPNPENRILLSTKLGMVKKDLGNLEARMRAAKAAGFDGIELDEAASITPEQAAAAVRSTGLFAHGAIDHKHWEVRHTHPDAAVRDQALERLKHCVRVSHAAGGSSVLLVIGSSKDGPEGADRARESIARAIPLAAALGQRILFENVWNGMFYQDDGPADQKVEGWRDYIDSFGSPWIGAYFDIGNHARYGRPGDWIRVLGPRIAKLDVKGYDTRAQDKWKGFVDITAGDLDWADVRKALQEIGFAGWSTAEVRGGDEKRLADICAQMKSALLGG
ncbi:MAG TPA: sugar phosphate isomerase/epimerase family protein [Planctomycetota bacterium]|nr:sugar phosphate isomerase/epimerase family protein [Planctomycetota bacterium]